MENPSAFPMGEPNDGFAQYFVGQSYLAPVLETPQIAIHNVTFEPGCRNNWHIHHNAAQVLIAVGGCGYYQIEGQEPKELKAGQAVCHPRGYEALAWRRPRRIMLASTFMVCGRSGIHEQRMARAGGCRSLRQTCLRSVVLIWRAILQSGMAFLLFRAITV